MSESTRKFSNRNVLISQYWDSRLKKESKKISFDWTRVSVRAASVAQLPTSVWINVNSGTLHYQPERSRHGCFVA